MASTTLFAPSVRAVQPAFIYTKTLDEETQEVTSVSGTVRIYFTLNYNTIDLVLKLRYSLIDPNKSSIDGGNSMIKITEDFTPEQDIEVIKDPSTQQITEVTINDTVKWTSSATDDYPDIPSNNEYYFEINFNNTSFKTLTVNLFYLVLVYLSDKDNPDPAVADDWSLPSTVSLIRPIAPIAASSISINEQKLTGLIEYSDDSTIETIASYSYTITYGGSTKYRSPLITNFLGTRLETIIPFVFEENTAYGINVNYITKHGYSGTISQSAYTKTGPSLESGLIAVVEDYPKIKLESGEIEFKFLLQQNNISKIRIDRASEFTNYNLWQTAAIISAAPADKFSITTPIVWRDAFAQSRTKYKYRIVNITNANSPKYLLIYGYIVTSDASRIAGKTYYTYNKIANLYNALADGASFPSGGPYYEQINTFEVDYEDIFLADTDMMLAIRYNPKISSYKWVTQDSITNTLGGKYPLVRRNGDLSYRQFNLSGTLYFDYHSASIGSCSISGINMNLFFTTEENSLYLSLQKAHEYATDVKLRRTLEKRMREIAAAFLSNGSVKLFRSGEEDTMIVYLSGVSFTPNATSGRHIYDFSATVTEICEATEENIIKYGFNCNEAIEYTWKYIVISATDSTVEIGSGNPNLFAVYVNTDWILNNNLILTAKVVTDEYENEEET